MFNRTGSGVLAALLVLTACHQASIAQEANAHSVETAVHAVSGEAIPHPRLPAPEGESNVEVVAQLVGPEAVPPIGQPLHPPHHPHPHHCHPKLILSGCKVTIHLVGECGTIAYWVDCCHHLALIKRTGSDPFFIYLTPECGDHCTLKWAIARFPSCDGCHQVWRLTHAGWELVDCCYLEILCH